MNVIDIPEVIELPNPAPYDEDPTAFGDLILTRLFHYESALLHAEYQISEKRISWFVRPRDGQTKRENLLVATSPNIGSFRTVLAGMNVRFSTTGIYGGFVMQSLRQNGRVYRCLIYTSNTGLSDYWIRIYAALIETR